MTDRYYPPTNILQAQKRKSTYQKKHVVFDNSGSRVMFRTTQPMKFMSHPDPIRIAVIQPHSSVVPVCLRFESPNSTSIGRSNTVHSYYVHTA